jgi:hypothetical protein
MSGIKFTCAKQLTAILGICSLIWINSVKQICEFALCNQLVCVWLYQTEATFLNCGDFRKFFSTTSYDENYVNTGGNDLRHSKNEKDWIIRIQAPKCAIVSIRRRFRDYNEMGWRKLTIFDETLRYSPFTSQLMCLGWVSLQQLSCELFNNFIKINKNIYDVINIFKNVIYV